MTRNTLAVLLLTGLLTTFTAGCSGNDEYIFEHGPAGPNTERTLEELPKGLRPDTTRANHTSDTLQPEE